MQEIRGITEATWIQTIISKLEVKHINLLLNVRSGEFKDNMPAIRHIIEELRYLRQMGLIKHDGTTLSTSKNVYLSELGEKIANYIELIEELSLNKEHSQKLELSSTE